MSNVLQNSKSWGWGLPWKRKNGLSPSWMTRWRTGGTLILMKFSPYSNIRALTSELDKPWEILYWYLGTHWQYLPSSTCILKKSDWLRPSSMLRSFRKSCTVSSHTYLFFLLMKNSSDCSLNKEYQHQEKVQWFVLLPNDTTWWPTPRALGDNWGWWCFDDNDGDNDVDYGDGD